MFFLFILRWDLFLLYNSLIKKQKEYAFDIKQLVLFIDCLNSRKQRLKVVSSCSKWSARSNEQGYTLVAPFLSKVSMICTFFVENLIKFDNSNHRWCFLNFFITKNYRITKIISTILLYQIKICLTQNFWFNSTLRSVEGKLTIIRKNRNT